MSKHRIPTGRNAYLFHFFAYFRFASRISTILSTLDTINFFTMDAKSANLFQILSEELRMAVDAQSIRKHFSAGDALFRKGSYIGSAAIVAEGVVKIFRVDEDGSSHFLYFLSSGELCVLSALCCMRMRKADMRAVAYTDCEVMFIPSPYPEVWMQEYPEWNRYLLQSFNLRMSELLDTFDSVIFRHLDERLLYYLLQHYNTGGERLYLSHQQIADELNSSREVISRLLKKLEDSGFVEVNRSFVRILPSITKSIQAK